MTLAEIRAQRPEGWKEVTEKLQKGEITQVQAAEELGISKAWLNQLLNRDDPTRKSRNPEAVRKIGLANRKYTTWIEQNFTDYEVCMMIKSRANCHKCPLSCKGYMKYKGLANALTQKVPLKAEEKPCEENADA